MGHVVCVALDVEKGYCCLYDNCLYANLANNANSPYSCQLTRLRLLVVLSNLMCVYLVLVVWRRDDADKG